MPCTIPGVPAGSRLAFWCREDSTVRRTIQTIVVFGLLLGARQAYADTVAVGDVLHLLGTDGNIFGGAFDVDNLSTGPGVDFKTFCVQLHEDVDYDNLFVVGAISDFADDDDGPDPISPETAWIFSSYRHGALSAFTSDEIQAAILSVKLPYLDSWSAARREAAKFYTGEFHQEDVVFEHSRVRRIIRSDMRVIP